MASDAAPKKTVLVIEDDPILVDMYKEKLKIERFRVITATDGKKALVRLKDRPDLILLDILMPHLNGFEVLKRIKKEPATSDIPVIVLTNLGTTVTSNDKDFALSLGASDYIIKSLSTPSLVVARVKSLLAD